MTSPSSNQPPTRPRRSKVRRRRRLGLMLVLVVLGILLLPIVLTRSVVVKAVVLPRIEAELGARVRVDRLVIEPNARIVAEGVSVRVRGLDGAPGELLEAERIEIASTWGDILSGSGTFSEMVLTRPRLRVSRDARTGAINLGELRAPSGPSSGAPPPRIVVREGIVEMGEQTDAGWALLRSLRVEGSASPTPTETGTGYELAFKEGSVSDAEGRGLGLSGRVTPGGVELALEGLEFGEWRPSNMPSDYREVFGLMRIEGGIPTASMRVGSDGEAAGEVRLDGVALNLPFDINGRAADPDNLVRLRDVTGVVRLSGDVAEAELVGLLGDLPAEVWLRYDGLEADSAFDCTIEITGYRLTSDPEVMPLAPEIVVKRLNDFSNPTAMVDASIELSRAAPSASGAGPIAVRGELRFRDGSATFRDFPYPFTGMTGLARFDEEKIEIVGIDGVAASGATLHATGVIAPPLPGAAVELHVSVEGAPIDDAMLAALGERRRGIVEALCNSERFGRLRAAGLLEGLGRFELGGLASVDLRIDRAFGEESEYVERVVVRFAELGLLPEPFPLPIVARDVEIEIEDSEALITRGTFAGLSGGTAEIGARVDLTKPDAQGIELSIEAAGVPADALLLAALPGGLDDSPSERSPSEVLRRLGVSGLIDCKAEVGAREDGELGYDIEVSLAGLSALPRHDPASAATALRLEGIEGDLLVSERELRLRVGSGVRAVGAAEPGGSISLDAGLGLGDGSRPFEAQVGAEIADVSLAVEDLVAVVAPTFGAQLGDLRAQRSPTGAVSLSADVAGDGAGEGSLSRLDIEVHGSRGLAFDHDAGRIGLTSERGSVRFSALGADAVEFDDWAAEVGLDGAPACEVRLSGRSPYGRAWAEGDALRLGVRGARLESPLIRRAVAGAMPEDVGGAMERHGVVAVFDADLELRGRADAARPRVVGSVRPLWCELTLASSRVSIASMAGGIDLDEAGGSFEAFRAEGDGWWVEASGEWDLVGDGTDLRAHCTLDGSSALGLTEEVRAMLPGPVRAGLGAISFEASGPVSAEGVRLSIEPTGEVSPRASGRVFFEGASADVGVRIAEGSGYLDFVADGSSYGVGVMLERARAAEIGLRDGMIRVTSDPQSGAVLVPIVLADVYGGRLTGSGIVQPGVGGGSTYDAEFRVSGVPLGELLADWEHAAGIAQASGEASELPERRDAEARGLVDAGLTLAGVVGDASTRRGRGTAIVGGEGVPVVRLPLLLPLIEVSNLQVPRNDPLDFGEAVFYLDGERVVFERLGVFARSVDIFGYGQMTLPELELDLRFSSRAVGRLPLVSDLLERFRDELITTRVLGTAGDPRVTVEQFTRTRRLFSGALGREPSEAERRMLEIERLSRESARRDWRAPRRAGKSQDAR